MAEQRRPDTQGICTGCHRLLEIPAHPCAHRDRLRVRGSELGGDRSEPPERLGRVGVDQGEQVAEATTGDAAATDGAATDTGATWVAISCAISSASRGE